MEFTFTKPEPKFFFGDLNPGDTFMDKDFGDDETVLMCIRIKDYDCEIKSDEPYYGYAINLKDGRIYGYASDEPVIPVSCNLTVK